ncbi:MAG: uroporphyrinogen-III synthase, partial [Chloroflexi bacterium]|nr:uroporphyrinogen-III synthase [Chloroflexota bacterium]
GFEPIYFPVIEIRPIENNIALDKAFDQLHCYAWVVFTSVNAVDVVFDYLAGSKRRDKACFAPSPLHHQLKIATIGPKTADALRKHNIEPDFVPDEYIAEAILPGLGDLTNKWVLLPRAEIARKELPAAISNAGGIAHEIVVYQTLPTEVDMDGLNALKSGVDVVTFTSASIVQNFVAIAKQNKLDPVNLPNNPLFACIGPITEQAVRAEGFQNIVTAKEYTTEGLIEAITNLEKL